MPMRRVTLPQKLRCRRCGHQWRPHQPVIRICPKCKSKYWQTERTNMAGTKPGKGVRKSRQQTTRRRTR